MTTDQDKLLKEIHSLLVEDSIDTLFGFKAICVYAPSSTSGSVLHYQINPFTLYTSIDSGVTVKDQYISDTHQGDRLYEFRALKNGTFKVITKDSTTTNVCNAGDLITSIKAKGIMIIAI